MTDIVERLRADAESTDDIGLCAEASDVIETLRSNLAEVAADWTKTQYELAAAQAREKVHIKALTEIRRICVETRIDWLASEALAQPTDDTALRAALAAERERCAKQCDWYGSYHKENYPGDPSLFISAEDCAEVIRALGDE